MMISLVAAVIQRGRIIGLKQPVRVVIRRADDLPYKMCFPDPRALPVWQDNSDKVSLGFEFIDQRVDKRGSIPRRRPVIVDNLTE